MTEKDSEKNSAPNGVVSYKGQNGGARPGAGRPKGSSNKISAKQLLEEAEAVIGKPFITSLMEGYLETINDGDRKHRVIYEKIIVDKVASQLLDVEVDDSATAVESKQAAFLAALAQINKDAGQEPEKTEDTK